MLSYMVPSIEKPPPAPRLYLDMLVSADSVRPLTKTTTTTISTESSVSSLSSGVVGDLAPTHGDKPKHISNGGTKLQSHKR